jgi:small subunit ribosomal protein S21
MLIIDARDSENIDKALKKYKKRYEKAGILKQLRNRQAFDKPSVVNRNNRLKAINREQYIMNLANE